MTDQGSSHPRPPDWYPDPFGRHELRYYDGSQWTEHVASHGRQSTDPAVGEPHVPTVNRAPEKIQRDVAKARLRDPNAMDGLRDPNAMDSLRDPNATDSVEAG